MTETYTHRITKYICLKKFNEYIYDPNSVFLHLHRSNRIFYFAQKQFCWITTYKTNI